MVRLRGLILAVIAASLICSIINSLLKDGMIKSAVQLLCGIFLVYTLLTYGRNVDIQFTEHSFREILADAQYEANMGAEKSKAELAKVIKAECETYILDKAGELGIRVSPEVSVSKDSLPLPTRVILQGTVLPDQKEWISQMIADDLGIAKEDQRWIG